MYWLLLPPNANAARQLSTDAGTPSDAWAHWLRHTWAAVVHLFPARR